MPIRFIIGLSLVGLTIIAFILFRAYTKKNKNPEERTDYSEDAAVAKVTTWVLGIAAVLLIASSCITVVGTRRIGVVTDFGRPVDSLSNGIHFKLPWQRVSELDGSIQTDSYIGSSDGDEQPCTDIRIGNESTACVDNTVRWRIVTAEADQLYRDFRNMDNIRESLVTRELNASLNQVLGDYNPLDAVNLDESGALANLDELADAVAESLRERVEGRVEVLSVTIPLINYDTRIAEEAEQTALAQARANEALSESVSNDPNVLVAQCFDLLGDMVDADQPIPAGFSCWPGGSSAVVLPAVPNTPQ
jgi:regulator of protease activity HflC (stomatin/prohibitin superfamily)